MLSASQIVKHFGAVKALHGVDFDLQAGEVHALFGANGAGKSTLAKVLTGHIVPDRGALHYQGRAVAFAKPRDALNAGVSIVTQETSLANDLSVLENIVLPVYGAPGRLRLPALRETAAAALAQLGHAGDFDLDASCRSLSSAQRQLIEIAKAIALDAKVIIFDEPTAALSPSETARLFSIMQRLRDDGHGMIFVSHRLEEIFAITDRITVLRDGRSVAQGVETASLDQKALIRLMIGRDLAAVGAVDVDQGADRPVALAVRDLAAKPAVRAVSFDLHEGEILGLGGLVGSGRSETAEALFGLRRRSGGSIALQGAPFAPTAPAQAIAAGIGFLAEDRRHQSIVPDFSVRENILLAHLGQRRGPGLAYQERAEKIEQLADLLELPRERLDDRSLLNFSGGMQQKALIMRALLLDPKVLILDEPTKGVDVGSRAAIYTLLRRIAAEGMAILLISSDFEELMALSHRIVPISDGRSLGVAPTAMIDEEQLTLLAAPRSSMDKQIEVLERLAGATGGVAFWTLLSAERALCLAASRRAGDLVGLSAGAVPHLADTAIPKALAASSLEFVEEAEGLATLMTPVQTARGHALGWIGLTLPQGARRPPSAEVHRSLRHLFSTLLEGQVDLAPAERKDAR
ncbi:MAG: sugar ABC transporter ATP-binding protein [Rhodospirillales bacterium]